MTVMMIRKNLSISRTGRVFKKFSESRGYLVGRVVTFNFSAIVGQTSASKLCFLFFR